VAQDEPHVIVGGMLGEGPFWGKKPFLERKSQSGRKYSWKEKQHMRRKPERRTCKGGLNKLGLGFFHDIVMVVNPRVCISIT